MKKKLSARRGSALLIVLGILSFMVVSAVAFSVLMRQSRLPSSFMRQKVTSAYLVKAGLANAMSEIDQAIGDNPYPGVGTSGDSDDDDFDNYWRNRILMLTQPAASGTDADSSSGSSSGSSVAEQAGAVSTMPLEGLAYIPPPLINTVRYWMKRSPTAVWKTLGYDAGRYAYTAVDVSDYMDLNRLHANVMRDCSPSNRISMAYMFENDQHTGDGTVSPENFDSFITQVSQNLDTRLVSMADYALASGSGQFGPTGFKNPFYDYVKSPPSGGVMYGGGESELANVRRQKFVTDSWYPLSLTNQTTTAKALTEADGQPFGSFDPTFDDGFMSLLQNNSSESFNRVMNHLNFPERVALKDYLDDDNVPTSLALPTLEHVPMLTGIRVIPVADTFKPQVEELEAKADTPVVNDDGSTVTTTKRLWKLKGFGQPQVLAQVTAVFPFKRSSLEKADGSLPGYTAHFFVKAYLLPDGQETDKTRLDTGASVRPTSASDWQKQNLLGMSQAPCLTFYGSSTLSVKSSRQQESDALITCDPVELTAQTGTDLLCPLYGVQIVEKTPSGGGAATKTITYDTSRFGELSGGNAIQYVEEVKNIGKAASQTIARQENEKLSLRWQFFAWVRITGDGGKTVDMFPACFKDDKTYNNIDQGLATTEGGAYATEFGEPSKEAVAAIKGPLAMKFEQSTFIDATTGISVPIDANNPIGFSTDGAQTLAIYCGDPRYNWAPEDWFAPGGDTISADGWLSAVKGSLTGENCRPHDIFQFVSNQGYLQSMGELQFLPLVRNDWNDLVEGQWQTEFTSGTSRYGGDAFAARSSAGSLANAKYMWKNYSFFRDNDSWTDDKYDPYNWDIVDAKDGAVVSPYAEEELMMAALANTPYDYIVTGLAESGDLTLGDGRPYCFSGFSSEARVAWDDLLKIATQVKTRISSGTDWWDFEDWTETGDKIFGQSVGCTIHDVDRKFLAAYWKNCFANRQQLFLVFVRAEPTVMGAASTGHTPAQLGARAVALVWREPVSSISDSGSSGSTTSSQHPHRMRILFYHQFE